MKKNIHPSYNQTVSITVLLLLVQAFTLDSLLAQSRLHTPVNHGLGGGGTAYIDSYQANFINPANLMLNRYSKPVFSIGFFGNTSATIGGSLANIEVYNNYLTTGLTIRDQVATSMLDDWFGQNPENIRSIDFEASHIPLGVAYRGDRWAAGFAIRNRALMDFDVSRGAAELFFLGLDSSVFGAERPVNMNIESLLLTEVSLGYSMELTTLAKSLGFNQNTRIYIGAAPKLLLTHSATKFQLDSRLKVQSASSEQNARLYHDFTYRAEAVGELAEQLNSYHNDRHVLGMNTDLGDYIEPPASDFYGIKAAGFGIDLGATVEMDLQNHNFPDLRIFKGEKKLRLALSFTDLGAARFGDNSGVFAASGTVDWLGFDHDQDLIDREFDGDEGAYYESVLVDSIGSDIYGNFSPVAGAKVSRTLPASVHLGSHLMAGRFGVMLDVGKGFNNRGINSKRVYAALGSQYRFFGVWPVRMGVKTGGFSSTSLHFGTGLEFRNFEFSLSAATVPRSRGYGSGAGFAWSGFVLHF